MNWKVYADGYYYPHLHIVNSEGKTVAVIPHGMVENKEENMRKAKVMAAAPKFLELNKKLLKQFSNYEEVTVTIEEIRRLIKKAEGDKK